jgi:hypothetical protein
MKQRTVSIKFWRKSWLTVEFRPDERWPDAWSSTGNEREIRFPIIPFVAIRLFWWLRGRYELEAEL